MRSAELVEVNNDEAAQAGHKQEPSPDLCLNKVMGVEITPSSLKDKFLLATFQIIAEHGADSLSANELIRKTDSSKGALFHHFKTLDELCLESLRFLRRNARLKITKPHSTLSEFVNAFVVDCRERFSSKAYFHIMHFFRDRALKDEKFRQALNDLFSDYIDNSVEQIMSYLSPAHRSEIREIVIFLFLTLERTCFRYATTNDSKETQDVVNWFIKSVEDKLLEYRT